MLRLPFIYALLFYVTKSVVCGNILQQQYARYIDKIFSVSLEGVGYDRLMLLEQLERVVLSYENGK